MEKQRPLPETIVKAAYAYHTGLFNIFKNWIELHKRAHGRFTELDALNVKREVERLIMEENKANLAALEFQMDPLITPYETFEVTW